MAYTAYVYYNILFSDAVDYDFAVAVAGGNYVNLAPRNAATLFGIPYPYPSGDMATINKTITFNPGSAPDFIINNPYPSGIPMLETVDSVTVPSQPGVPSGSFPAGAALTMIWTGVIQRINAGAGEDPAPPNVMSQRRWIQGMEISPLGEGGTAGNSTAMCRPASRTNGGFGFAVRGNNTNPKLQNSVSQQRTGLVTATSWERFYFRLRTAPASPCGVWRAHGFPSAGAGAALKVNADRTFSLIMLNSISTEVIVGALPAVSLNTWYRFDIFVRMDTAAEPAHGKIAIYVNGVLILSYTDLANQGVGGNTRHTDSDLGKWTATVDNSVEYDVDDWINADLPANVSSNTLGFIDTNYPFDWLVGSHIRALLTTSASMTGWTPVNREVLNQGNSSTSLEFNLSQTQSTTNAAILDGTTNHTNTQDEMAQKFGPVAAIVSDNSANGGALDGKAGYALAGGANVLTTIVQTGTFGVHAVQYFPTGLLLPPDIVPFHVVKQKSADASQDITIGLQAVMEYLGTWGPEDAEDMPQIATQDFLHNCRYTTENWGYLGGNTDGPVMAIGGTYVGNGTFQDINLSYPCHFLLIRPTTGSSAGVRFYGASVDACKGDSDQSMPNVRVWVDSLLQHKFTVAGVDAECNAVGVTYQYIAFCDPGMRYNICGAYNHPQAGASPVVNDLSYINTSWTPEWGWVQNEIPSVSSGTVALYSKGPSGVAGVAGVTNRGVSVAQFGAFAAGQFSSRSGIHFNSAGQTNYSLWRKADTCGYTMLQIFSYVGNGVASRVITFPDVTGRYPLFAHVQPANGTSIFRDPSHTAANSSLGSTMAVTANGITAGGVDSITVGLTLNANLINYDVFIILGSNLSWANGTYSPPECQGAYQPPARPALPEIAIRAEGGMTYGGTAAITLLKDVSGIYTLVPGKTNDTLIDRQTGVDSVDVKIPDPYFKTGYIGG